MLSDEKRCFLCGSYNWLECHHIFHGSNRKNSERYKDICTVWLCHYCHNEPKGNINGFMFDGGVHHNRAKDLYLMRTAQKRFEEEYSRETFIGVFGRNYLED